MIAICNLISKSNLFVQHTRINNIGTCSPLGLLDNKSILRCPFELQTKILVAQMETDCHTNSFPTKPIFKVVLFNENQLKDLNEQLLD